MHSPTPDLPVTLQASHLTIPPPSLARITPNAPSLPSLHLKIIPQLLVHGDLASPRIFGRGLESCVDVVIPVGGKVVLGVNVVSDYLRECGVDGVGEDVEEVEETVRRVLSATIAKNYTLLSLSPSCPITRSPTDLSTFNIHPTSSDPNRNPSRNHIVSAGHPTAYLQRVDVVFSWVATRGAGEKNDSAEHLEEEGGGDHQSDVMMVEDGGEEAEEMMVLDEDEPASIDEEDDIRSVQGAFEAADITTEVDVPNRPQIPSTDWMDLQMRRAIERLLVRQFIQRFPLVFDGHLSDYATSLQIPQSFASSISSMLRTAHGMPSASTLQASLTKLSLEQSKTFERRVHQAARLPARKETQSEIRKRRRLRIEQQSQQEQTQNSSPGDDEDGELDEEVEREQRAERYLAGVRQDIATTEADARRPQETMLHRVLSEAIAHIGRREMEEKRRKGRSNLAYCKVKLQHPDDTDSPTPMSPISTISTPSPDALDSDDDGEDDDIINITTDYDSSVGGEEEERDVGLDDMFDGGEGRM
ncbi:hypothetical protein IAT38_004009 [Cryptococcus sp. DSM 104549]